jgi:anion-transporting  ArsA/GET3 family ATPase
MGLDQLSHDPQAIDISTLSTAGNGGSLHGMMLDTKRTFDHLVEKYAPNDEVRQAIFNNRHYQHVSSSLAGSREFMAMERVYEIVIEDRYDLVVVDTPPSQHALDFIDAPRRMFDLFEGRFVALLLKPYQVVGKRSFEFLHRGSERPLKFMAKLTGYQFLAELAEFFLAFSDMFEGFKERSERVRELLLKDDSSFLLICAPEPGSLKQAEHFFHRLQGDSLPVGGMIVNRVHHARGPDSLGEAAQNEIRQFAAALDPAAAPGQAGSETDLAERLLLCYREQHALAQADHYAISQTRVAEQRIAIHNVPHFEHDLHSLEDIQAFADKLADPQETNKTLP